MEPYIQNLSVPEVIKPYLTDSGKLRADMNQIIELAELLNLPDITYNDETKPEWFIRDNVKWEDYVWVCSRFRDKEDYILANFILILQWRLLYSTHEGSLYDNFYTLLYVTLAAMEYGSFIEPSKIFDDMTLTSILVVEKELAVSEYVLLKPLRDLDKDSTSNITCARLIKTGDNGAQLKLPKGFPNNTDEILTLAKLVGMGDISYKTLSEVTEAPFWFKSPIIDWHGYIMLHENREDKFVYLTFYLFSHHLVHHKKEKPWLRKAADYVYLAAGPKFGPDFYNDTTIFK